MNPYYLCFLTLLTSLLVAFTAKQPVLVIHALISCFAVGLLIVASVQAILLGCQNYWLKHPRMRRLFLNLPPLQTMEAQLFKILLGGTLLFSASVITGFIFQPQTMWGIFEPKIAFGLGTWIVLHLLLLGRRRFGWRGPTAIRWTLGATVLALFSYLGTRAFL